MKTKLMIGISWLVVGGMAGCSSTPTGQIGVLQNQLDAAKEQNTRLFSQVEKSNAELERLAEANKQLQLSGSGSGNALMPPNAKPGECYARVLTPASYRLETQELLKKEASHRIEVTEPEYEWVTERVLVKAESEVADIIPARYEWQTETVLVKEAHEHLSTVPPVYQTKTEQILVKPAYTTWKKGRGPIQKIDNATGEIMCLIEVPAEYKTVTSRVLVSPAKTEKTLHPAVYKDVKKKVMVAPPKMVKRTIPAEYATIKVRKVVRPAQERRIEVPAEYQTVSNRVKVSDSFLEWRSILCETNTTPNVVSNMQRALLQAGHHPGAIDGVIGNATLNAMKNYQREKNLATGQVTLETLQSLGVSF